MSTLRNIVFGCVSDHGQEVSAAASATSSTRRPTKVKFGVPLANALGEDQLPEPLVEMLVYIAQEGVATPDLFRRPGNPTDVKVITKRLIEGRSIDFNNYNFYTLASVIKKYLLKLPGGVFGPEIEQQLLRVLDIDNKINRYDSIHSILLCLPAAALQLVTLLFGTWFRIISHSECNTMSSESVAKSVAGSLFHTCSDHPDKINRAVRILQILIDDFAVASMFGSRNIKYFAEVTHTAIGVTEKFKYRLSYSMAHHEGTVDTAEIEDTAGPLVELLPVFSNLVQSDTKSRGLDPVLNAVTEAEFYRSPETGSNNMGVRHSLDTAGCGSSYADFRLAGSTPPSPAQSLQQQGGAGDGGTAEDYNPHKKLTHVSSLSAPEVNQVCMSVPPETRSVSPSPYLSTSLSRFDSVKRRQLLRMRKRSNWFLSPPTAGSTSLSPARRRCGGIRPRHHHDDGSHSSADGASFGISSMDPISSDAGISDDISDVLRISSDLDCCPTVSTVVPALIISPDSRSTSAERALPTTCQLSLPTSSAFSTVAAGVALQPRRRSTQGKEMKEEDIPTLYGSTAAAQYFIVQNFYGDMSTVASSAVTAASTILASDATVSDVVTSPKECS